MGRGSEVALGFSCQGTAGMGVTGRSKEKLTGRKSCQELQNCAF